MATFSFGDHSANTPGIRAKLLTISVLAYRDKRAHFCTRFIGAQAIASFPIISFSKLASSF
jgi:hypothetical protein